MGNKDDVFLVIVSDSEENDTSNVPISIKKEKLDETEAALSLDDVIKTVEKYGEYIDIHDIPLVKQEPSNDNQHEMYVEENYYDGVKVEDLTEDDDEYVLETEEESDADDECMKKRRVTMRKPHEQKSFVEHLRKQIEHKKDTKLLIKTLSDIMRSVMPPPPPRDYYIMNGIDFECVICSHLSGTLSAAARHYQEKHGQRYLVCYACGVDFRSTTNLYKHEKRCPAPDAKIVLKARALFLGRKGRSRPFLPKPHEIITFRPVASRTSSQTTARYIKSESRDPTSAKFMCGKCPAVFLSRTALQSHEYMHQGLRPFRCDQCSAAYTSSSALCRHREKHTNVQYICDHCNRSFKIKTALVSHLDTHLPERKHKCEECEKRFAQKFALVLHVNSKHRHLPPPCACQICPKRYPRMSLLKAHMQREHGMILMTRKMFFKSLPRLTETEIENAKVVLKSETNKFYSTSPFNWTKTLKQKEKDTAEEVTKYVQIRSNETENKYNSINNNKMDEMNDLHITAKQDIE